MAKVSETPGCENCPMRKLFPKNNFVPMKPGTGKRLAIAEAPGETESTLLEILVGAAGKWYDSMLRAAGLKRDNISLLNVIQCRPPDNMFPDSSDARSYIKLDDARKAIAHCVLHHVVPVLESKDWERVDLLGDKALKYIGNKHEGISTWRGSPIEIDTEEIRARCEETLHVRGPET